MKKIGVLGGTFSPIHIGHLMLADCAKEELELDEVWLVPTGFSYHKMTEQKPSARKPSIPTPEERLEMVEAAASEVPYFHALDIEVKREGNTYSYETLEYLKSQYPEDEFYFIIGADCLASIEGWKNPDRIFKSCQIVAAVRENVDITEMEKKADYLKKAYRARIILLAFRNLQLSSTEIRERVQLGKSIRYMVPDCVEAYIRKKGFYRDENS